MSTLTALGLPHMAQPGEALVWSTPVGRGANRVAVGVDVGRSADLGRLVAQAAPAILVLTHDDLDHIGGWSGFAPLGLETLQELWIPYEWAALLDSYDALSRGTARIEERVPVPVMAERLRSDFRPAPQFGGEGASWRRSLDHDARRDDLDEDAVATEIRRISREMHRRARMQNPHAVPDFFEGEPDKIAGRVKEQVNELGAILRETTTRGVTVRLFSGDHIQETDDCFPWLKSAGRYLVSIANAIEVLPVAVSESTLSDLAYRSLLSIQNRRALCPVLWHRGWVEGGTIVWSDSSGTWVDRPLGSDALLELVSISTAPHHGSDTIHHDSAWGALDRFVHRSNNVMVCAGGQWNQGVAAPFTDLEASNRGCTRCRHLRRGGRSVVPKGSRTVTIMTDGRHPRFVEGDTCPS